MKLFTDRSGRFMDRSRLFMDRSRLYLVLIYFSMSFFYVSVVLSEEEDPIPLLGYILALIIVIITSHDTLLRIISQAMGQHAFAGAAQDSLALAERKVLDRLLAQVGNAASDRGYSASCSAASVVEQAVALYPFRPGERARLQLHLEQDCHFSGVESLFVYILFNLLKNAFHSAQAPETGELSIKLLRSEPCHKLIFRDPNSPAAPEFTLNLPSGQR